MKLMSTVLKEMYKPEDSFVHVITTSYKTMPNRTTVNQNHAKVESGEGSIASWYNKAKFFSRNNPDHHVYLKTFKKIKDAAGSTNFTHHAHHHFIGGQEVSSFDLREEESLNELYNDRSGGGGHGHPFFHKITAIDRNYSETKVQEGYGDPFHWLHLAQQLSVKNPNHVFKVMHHQLVHFRNGGSGYQHTGQNRYFHQGRETSLTNPNLHELNDTSKGPQSFPGDGHWSGNWFVIHHDIRTGKKRIPQAYRWMSKEAAYAAAKHDNNNWFIRDTNKAKFGFPKFNPDKEKRKTGEGQTFREYYFPCHARDVHKHGFKLGGSSKWDMKEEVELDELYDSKKGGGGNNWGAPYYNTILSDTKKFHEGYGDVESLHSSHEKAKEISSKNLGVPIHLHHHQLYYDKHEKRYTGYQLAQHRLYMNGQFLHDVPLKRMNF